MIEKVVQKCITTCHKCSTKMSFTEEDILYSHYIDSCEYYVTYEIHGYVKCPLCGNYQFIGILETDFNLNREEFSRLYAGRIYNW